MKKVYLLCICMLYIHINSLQAGIVFNNLLSYNSSGIVLMPSFSLASNSSNIDTSIKISLYNISNFVTNKLNKFYSTDIYHNIFFSTKDDTIKNNFIISINNNYDLFLDKKDFLSSFDRYLGVWGDDLYLNGYHNFTYNTNDSNYNSFSLIYGIDLYDELQIYISYTPITNDSVYYEIYNQHLPDSQGHIDLLVNSYGESDLFDYGYQIIIKDYFSNNLDFSIKGYIEYLGLELNIKYLKNHIYLNNHKVISKGYSITSLYNIFNISMGVRYYKGRIYNDIKSTSNSYNIFLSTQIRVFKIGLSYNNIKINYNKYNQQDNKYMFFIERKVSII